MRSCAAVFLFLVAGQCLGAEVDLSIESSVARSDNITRSPTDKVPETIRSIGLDVELSHVAERIDASLRGDVRYNDYQDNIFEDESVRSLDAQAMFTPVAGNFGSFRWQIIDNAGQQTTNPFLVATPENRQDVNYLTTGPMVDVNLGERGGLALEARASSIDYEVTPADNDRTGATLILNRLVSSRTTIGIGTRVDSIEYKDAPASNFDKSEVFFRHTTALARITVNLEIGVDEIETLTNTVDGDLARLDLQKRFGSFSTFFFRVDKAFSDAGNLFREFQNEGRDVGGNLDILGIADPFTGTIRAIGMRTARGDSSFDVELSSAEEEYETQTQFDRVVRRVSLWYERRVGPAWSFNAEALRDFREYADGREDDEISGTLGLSRSFNPVWRLEIDLQRVSRETVGEADSRDDNRLVVALAYVPWRSVE